MGLAFEQVDEPVGVQEVEGGDAVAAVGLPQLAAFQFHIHEAVPDVLTLLLADAVAVVIAELEKQVQLGRLRVFVEGAGIELEHPDRRAAVDDGEVLIDRRHDRFRSRPRPCPHSHQHAEQRASEHSPPSLSTQRMIAGRPKHLPSNRMRKIHTPDSTVHARAPARRVLHHYVAGTGTPRGRRPGVRPRRAIGRGRGFATDRAAVRDRSRAG